MAAAHQDECVTGSASTPEHVCPACVRRILAELALHAELADVATTPFAVRVYLATISEGITIGAALRAIRAAARHRPQALDEHVLTFVRARSLRPVRPGPHGALDGADGGETALAVRPAEVAAMAMSYAITHEFTRRAELLVASLQNDAAHAFNRWLQRQPEWTDEPPLTPEEIVVEPSGGGGMKAWRARVGRSKLADCGAADLDDSPVNALLRFIAWAQVTALPLPDVAEMAGAVLPEPRTA